MASGDTWTLQLTAEDLALIRWGLDQVQGLITPAWRRLGAQVEDDLRRGQLDPRRTFQALWLVIAAYPMDAFAARRAQLRALALRIKDAVEIIAALEETHG